MKKLTLLLLLISQSILSQIKYVESDTDSYIDFTNKKVNLTYNENSIEGNFTEVTGNYGFIIVEGNENIWIIKLLSDLGIKGMDILKGDYKTILKEFKKGRKYKKSELLFTNLQSEKRIMDGYRLLTQSEVDRDKKLKEIEDLKKKSEMEFDSKISNSDYLGVYKIKILKHRKLDYKNTDTFGKMIITEVGITIETDIPSVNLLRGSYVKDKVDLEKGTFLCNISKGYGDFFSLSFGKEKSFGGLTTSNGRINTTTIFKVVE
ncbi:hypothetical protein N8147_00170 [Flavobacteriaceae bacterium]|nr:hypothetical protein [Flavobacteriaceae bacterium]